ncbi:uncharacterized protein G2W53_032858 [Senna tora]|uniref:Uncharacterized protein n=1 Tax=Senna tora TaxID=362788 RepID=A0A834W7B1_9FABA|nr:uncharacterized protein G2W53_032858 [Senna tora]
MVRFVPEEPSGGPSFQLLSRYHLPTASLAKSRMVPLPVSINSLQQPSGKDCVPIEGLDKPHGCNEDAGTMDAILGETSVECTVQRPLEPRTEGLHGCSGTEWANSCASTECNAIKELPSGDKRGATSVQATGPILQEHYGASLVDSQGQSPEQAFHNKINVGPNSRRVFHVLNEARNRVPGVPLQSDAEKPMGNGDSVLPYFSLERSGSPKCRVQKSFQGPDSATSAKRCRAFRDACWRSESCSNCLKFGFLQIPYCRAYGLCRGVVVDVE